MADLLLKKETPVSRLGGEHAGAIFFFVSLGLFLLLLASYGGLFLLNRAQGETLTTLQDEIASKEESVRPELIQQILHLDERLANIRTLLAEHIFFSNSLRLVERDVHPQVRFINFTTSRDAHRIDMTGEAAGYASLAEQIAIFEQDPEVEKVDFGGLTLGGKNLLGFKITVQFKEALLHLRP